MKFHRRSYKIREKNYFEDFTRSDWRYDLSGYPTRSDLDWTYVMSFLNEINVANVFWEKVVKKFNIRKKLFFFTKTHQAIELTTGHELQT